MSAYSASKFAVRGLTQAVGETQFDSEVEPLFMVGNIAQELRPHKITVNCYAPGFILTPMRKPCSGLMTNAFVLSALSSCAS